MMPAPLALTESESHEVTDAEIERETTRRYDPTDNDWDNDWEMERLSFIDGAKWALSAKASPSREYPCADVPVGREFPASEAPAATPASEGDSNARH